MRATNLPTATGAVTPASTRAAVLATAMMPRLPDSIRPLIDANEHRDEDTCGWRMPKKVPTDVIPLLPTTIAEHERALQPGSLDELGIVLGRLLAHYHTPERGEASYRMLFEDYLDDLSEFPLAVVGEAARQWRRTKVFWPKVAELRELCDRIYTRELDRLARMAFLAWCADRFGGRLPEFKPYPEWPIAARDGLTSMRRCAANWTSVVLLSGSCLSNRRRDDRSRDGSWRP